MSKALKGVYIALWFFLVISSFFQFVGITSVTNLFGHAEQTVEISFLPFWILSAILLPIAAVLCGVFSKKEKWPFLPMGIALVGTLLAVIVVFSMSGVDAFQERFDPRGYNDTLGLSTFTIIYRHGLPVLIGVVLSVICYLNHKNAKETRVYAEMEAYKEHYLLDGEPLFKDENKSTLGLNEYAEDFSVDGANKKRKLKKSQKKAKEKLLKKK